MFQEAIKIDCLVLANYQNFYWFVSYMFVKLAHSLLNECFKRRFKLFLDHFSVLSIFNDIKHFVVFFFVRLVS